jgi:hypothetical protein
VLDLTDHHTDLTAQFTASGATLTGSRTYGQWGRQHHRNGGNLIRMRQEHRSKSEEPERCGRYE